MYERGWRVELLSWKDSCSRRMRKWVNIHGKYVPLDTHSYAIRFLEPSKPDWELAPPRASFSLDLELWVKDMAPTVCQPPPQSKENGEDEAEI